MRKERKGGCALSVALWSLCCRGLCRVGTAWQLAKLISSSLKSRSLTQIHTSSHLSQYKVSPRSRVNYTWWTTPRLSHPVLTICQHSSYIII